MLPSQLLYLLRQEPRYPCYQAHYYTKNPATHATMPTTTPRTQVPMLSSPLLHQEPRYPCYQAHYYTKNPGTHATMPTTTPRTQVPMLLCPLLHQEPRYPCYQAHCFTHYTNVNCSTPTGKVLECCSAPLTSEGQFNTVTVYL